MKNACGWVVLLSVGVTLAGCDHKREVRSQGAGLSKIPTQIDLDDNDDVEVPLKAKITHARYRSELKWNARASHIKSEFKVHFTGKSPCWDATHEKTNNFEGDKDKVARCEINTYDEDQYEYNIITSDKSERSGETIVSVVSCRGCIIDTRSSQK